MHEWIEEITITELQEKMASGDVSALELVDIYLERVEALDTSGPMLNAVIEINPDARETATQLDAERGAGNVRGPLHGIPMMLKDNFDTADQMQTTAGSLALEGSYSSQDSMAAAKLRQAGAVFLGKTNLSEWANFRSTHSISGWSSRGRTDPQPLCPGPHRRVAPLRGRPWQSQPICARPRSAQRQMDRSSVRPRPTALSGSNPPWA